LFITHVIRSDVLIILKLNEAKRIERSFITQFATTG